MSKQANFQDEVKHKTSEMTGTVIAKYPNPLSSATEFLLDIRGFDGKIYYGSPAEYWEVIHTAYELGQE